MNHGGVCVCWTGFCMLPSSIFPPLCHRLHFKIPLLRSTCPEDSGWVGKWKGVEWRGSEFDTRPKSQRIISYPLSFEISSLDKISYMWMKADFQHTYTRDYSYWVWVSENSMNKDNNTTDCEAIERNKTYSQEGRKGTLGWLFALVPKVL